jgi:4-hydroxy-3-polyprenylbenzoate decarboxylase
MRIILAITGATGAGFSIAVAKRLVSSDRVTKVTLLISDTGRCCMNNECGNQLELLLASSPKFRHLDEYNLEADIASGSSKQNGMVIIPCSVGTLGRIASGTSEKLISRSADVCLKERRPLILCVRETPLNRIHLKNMLIVSNAGAVVMPIAPSFYHNPKTIEDLFQSFATRVLDQLGIFENDNKRWQGL